MNGGDHYTVFDVPISVTNRIDDSATRPSCDSLNNSLLTPEEIAASASKDVGILFAPNDATVVEQTNPGKDGNGNNGNGIGPGKPEASPSDGLGSAASTLVLSRSALYASLLCGIIAIMT